MGLRCASPMATLDALAVFSVTAWASRPPTTAVAFLDLVEGVTDWSPQARLDWSARLLPPHPKTAGPPRGEQAEDGDPTAAGGDSWSWTGGRSRRRSRSTTRSRPISPAIWRR